MREVILQRFYPVQPEKDDIDKKYKGEGIGWREIPKDNESGGNLSYGISFKEWNKIGEKEGLKKLGLIKINNRYYIKE